MTLIRSVLVALLLCASSHDAYAQVSNAAIPGLSGYVHSWWKEREGLPGGAIYGITTTADGYMWLATSRGLLRFDGHRFVRWTPFGQQDAVSGAVTAVHTARDGSLLVGFATGRIARISGGTFSYTPDASVTGIVDTLQDSSDGSIWSFHNPFALQRFINGAWSNFEHDAVASRILGLFRDSRGRIWVGTETGAAVWSPDAQRFRPAGPEGTPIFAVGEDRAGRMLAVSSQAVHVIEGAQAGTSLNLPRRIFPNGAHVDRGNNLWIGTQDAGLYRVVMSEGVARFEHFGKPDGLTSDVILSIFEDREGNIWVAGSNGLNRFRERRVESLSSLSYRSSVLGLALAANPDGSVWVGTTAGLVRFETRGGVAVERETRFRDRTALAVSVAANRDPLVGLLRGELAFIGSTPLAPRLFKVPSTTGVNAIAQQRSGTYWLADRSGGLISWRDDAPTQSSRIEGTRLASAAIVDRRDTLWVGFADGGVLALSASGQRNYGQQDGLSGGAVLTVYEDRKGTVWAGTDKGLSRFDGERFSSFTRQHGLPADAVSEVIEDRDGNFWLGTSGGLVRIQRENIDRLGSNATPQLAGTIYDANDGLAGMPAHFGNPGATRLADGRLWFLTQSGIAIVDPSRKIQARPAPPVHVEAMTADDRELNLAAPVILPPGTRTLSFDYTAPDLSVPEKVHFRYTLEGFEDLWHEAGTRRQAFYNDLPPGSYRFRVVASNNEGTWNSAGAVTSFALQPALYQTTAFRVLSAVAAILGAWALHRARLWQLARRLRAQFEMRAAERAHIATELHDTLIQDLAAMSLQAEVADDQLPAEPDAAKATIEKLRSRLHETVGKGRAGMTELRFGVGAADHLAEALSRTARELGASYTGTFNLVVQGQPRGIHPLVGDEVCRIAREAMGNAFRHAGATRIDVEILFGETELRVTVHDDGRGIDPEIIERGREGHLGLHLMRDRARRIGGKLKLWSRAHEGTEVVLIIPGRTAFQPAAP